MLRLAVLVSGGGTNLQAIIDAIDKKTITNAEISVVISNNPGAYALERAKTHELTRCAYPRKTMRTEQPSIRRFLRPCSPTSRIWSFLQAALW